MPLEEYNHVNTFYKTGSPRLIQKNINHILSFHIPFAKNANHLNVENTMMAFSPTESLGGFFSSFFIAQAANSIDIG